MIGAFGSSRWSEALSEAVRWHEGQTRKGSGLPYVIHCIEVAAVLERLGFDEPVVIAGLLHDTLEDTEIPRDFVRDRFGSEVLETVDALTETKCDDHGAKRPWIDRKREHVRTLRQSSRSVRAVALADQWQNLSSVLRDRRENDTDFWAQFNASPGDYVRYHRRRLEACAGAEPGIRELSGEVAALITELESRLEVSGIEATTRFTDSDWA